MSSPTAFARLATFAALALTATTVDVDAAGVARASTSTEPPPDGTSADTIEGLFDVGGDRRLHLKCEGTGSPTIVYLHGAGGTSTNVGGDSRTAQRRLPLLRLRPREHRAQRSCRGTADSG